MSRIEDVVRELWELVDTVECSDNGKYFFPTELKFSSCRTMSGVKLGKLIIEMKTLAGVPPRMSDEELHLLNHPTDCPTCLGKGHFRQVECKACGGSGSTDPTVPMICTWCNGTGDMTNHERYSDDCLRCDRSGRVTKCTAPDCIELGDDCKVCNGYGVIPVKDW